ncbi:hypothetical protein Poli38472_000843 [Pythium oligandrum]|uniref:FYVE-type domain-containing protein n=1 Tax=Pythium oligandrum TaxID=41045 RepID=A0A8K1CCG2_PYTOL|nr:hypothetical protein Poli38472_000843 [Pythium oligandrum]|eukprot:TMW60801.1 hypothetical protein Poli38472_000843 [Pythium oligandrum]
MSEPLSYSLEIARQYKARVHITKDIEGAFEDLGDARVRDLFKRVADDDAGGDKRAKLLQEKENYRIYEIPADERTTDANGTPLMTMKAVIYLQSSSCEEVMNMLSSRATAQVAAMYADFFGGLYVDSVSLHESSSNGSNPPPVTKPRGSSVSSVSATPISTSMGVHWLMLRDLSTQLPARDFVFMRYSQMFAAEDPSSTQRVSWGATVWESVNLPTCQSVVDVNKVRRCNFTQCGFLVEASEQSDSTRVTFFITGPQGTTTPAIVRERQWLMNVAICVRSIPGAIVNYRIRYNQVVDKKKWVSRDACELCTQTFNLFKRQHHCRMCGAAVCSKCSVMRSNSVRVCLSCLKGEDSSAMWGTNSSSSNKSTTTTTAPASTTTITSSVIGRPEPVASVMAKEAWASSTAESGRSSLNSSNSSNRLSGQDDGLDEGFRYLQLSANRSSTVSRSSTVGDEDDILENTPYSYGLRFARGNPWPDPPMPANEEARLKRINTLNLSQQYAKENLKELLDLARTSINCPVAAVAVVSVSKILLVTAVGLAGDQVPRDVGLESHAIMSTEPLVVLDAEKDERFSMNPLVSTLNIRFYISLPLVTKEGIVVGALSLGDTTARAKVNGSDLRSLQLLASRIIAKMDPASSTESSQSSSGLLLL